MHPPTPPAGSTPTPTPTASPRGRYDDIAPEHLDAPHREPAVHPLDELAGALDKGPTRSSPRKEARSGARARRRAEKQAAKETKRLAREQAEAEAIAERAAADAAAEDTAVLPSTADPLAAVIERAPEPEAAPEPEPANETGAKTDTDDDDEDEGRALAVADALVARLPAIPAPAAAIISGALAGLAAVGLAFGAASGCDSVRGTESCGGGIGLLAIVAILAIEVAIGANLLKAWQISDPFSTSFLGVGLVATLAMLIFLDELDSSWMLLVIPLMTAVAFVLSWWVTVRFIDEHEMASEIDSERGEPDFPGDHGPVPRQHETQGRDPSA